MRVIPVCLRVPMRPDVRAGRFPYTHARDHEHLFAILRPQRRQRLSLRWQSARTGVQPRPEGRHEPAGRLRRPATEPGRCAHARPAGLSPVHGRRARRTRRRRRPLAGPGGLGRARGPHGRLQRAAARGHGRGLRGAGALPRRGQGRGARARQPCAAVLHRPRRGSAGAIRGRGRGGGRAGRGRRRRRHERTCPHVAAGRRVHARLARRRAWSCCARCR